MWAENKTGNFVNNLQFDFGLGGQNDTKGVTPKRLNSTRDKHKSCRKSTPPRKFYYAITLITAALKNNGGLVSSSLIFNDVPLQQKTFVWGKYTGVYIYFIAFKTTKKTQLMSRFIA